jgi:hypothetical protein
MKRNYCEVIKGTDKEKNMYCDKLLVIFYYFIRREDVYIKLFDKFHEGNTANV